MLVGGPSFLFRSPSCGAVSCLPPSPKGLMWKRLVSVHGEVTEWGLGSCPGLLYHQGLFSVCLCAFGVLSLKGGVLIQREREWEGGGRGDKDERGGCGRERETKKERGGKRVMQRQRGCPRPLAATSCFLL